MVHNKSSKKNGFNQFILPIGYKGDQIVLNDGTRNGYSPVYNGPDYLK